MITVKDLEAFGAGWNRHDVDMLVTFMTDDCVFKRFPDVQFCDGKIAVKASFLKNRPA